jgi:acetyl-CoA C-acetyltransferase
MSNKEIVITSAFRTAIGSFGGSLASKTAPELGAEVIKKCLEHSELKPADVDTVFMGQVLQAGAQQNPARQAAIKAGLPNETISCTVNQLCASGLTSVGYGYNSILLGEAKVAICGGQESMSNAPHMMNLRNGVKMGPGTLEDSMLKDGLMCAFNGYHMGITAENVAEKYQITRAEQDDFASASQRKAVEAIKAKKFKDEIVPVKVKVKKDEVTFDTDEYPKDGVTVEKLQKLRPAFKKEGTVTAGNASGINDGAAAVVLMTAEEAKNRDIEPLAKIVSWAVCGVDPSIMGTGPIPASRKALEKAGWGEDQLDVVEANEAFAAQAIAVNKELGFTPDRVNVNGGAIALGHPIGASGARVLVSLIHEMQKRKAKKGLATLCVGGGMGIAMCIERNFINHK